MNSYSEPFLSPGKRYNDAALSFAWVTKKEIQHVHLLESPIAPGKLYTNWLTHPINVFQQRENSALAAPLTSHAKNVELEDNVFRERCKGDFNKGAFWASQHIVDKDLLVLLWRRIVLFPIYYLPLPGPSSSEQRAASALTCVTMASANRQQLLLGRRVGNTLHKRAQNSS